MLGNLNSDFTRENYCGHQVLFDIEALTELIGWGGFRHCMQVKPAESTNVVKMEGWRDSFFNESLIIEVRR